MKRTTVDDLHKKWMKNPKYRREYETLKEEFSLSAALIEARARAGLTQEQVAQRMKTTQAVVARLEGGGSDGPGAEDWPALAHYNGALVPALSDACMFVPAP